VTALAVACVAAATLAYQILLVRLFAIEQFHHFASMAIGVAMLGGGASGTIVALARPGAEAARRWLPWSASLAALALVAAPALVGLVPVDPTQLAWRLGQWPRLALQYLLLALPFALGGLTVLLALAAAPSRAGALYGASFIGAGFGAVTALAALAVATPVRALAVPAFVAGSGAVVAGLAFRSRPRLVGAAVAWCAGALTLAHPPWRLHLLPYKALAQAEAYPGAARIFEMTGPLGWVVGLRAPALRFAPGLSLAYRGEFPPQTGLFLDAELVGAVTQWDSATTRLLDWLPASLPYALGGRRRVLVLGGAAGMDVPAGLAHGAAVTAVELDPALARAASTGLLRLRGGGDVRWVIGDARAFIAHTRRQYDLITLGPTGGIGGVAAGVYSLNEDFLHTVEAYERMLERLTPGGVLAVTSWLALPPRGEVRVILTAAEALRRRDPAAPARGLVVARSWGTVTTLVKPSGFADTEIAALERWAEARWLDLDWRPGLSAPDSRFNFLDPPAPFEAARAAAASRDDARRFARAYPLRVAPATDARPYPHHFLDLRALGALAPRGAGEWLPFAELGYVALVATLAQSLVLAAVLLLAPVLGGAGARGAVGRELVPLLAYFGAIGLAYLAAELAAIQQLTLLLGHPVYAVVATLAVLLVSSGAGSWWSDRRRHDRALGVLAGLALLLAVWAVVLLALVHRAESWPLLARGLAAAVVLAPLGMLMGMPFPLGLRALAGGDVGRIAWAWAANGCASVVAAPLAAIVGMEMGSGALLASAAAAYGAAGAIVALRRGDATVSVAGPARGRPSR
jgi:spermidine synthase